MKQIPVAVQLYSVRDEAEKDFAGTVKKLQKWDMTAWSWQGSTA